TDNPAPSTAENVANEEDFHTQMFDTNTSAAVASLRPLCRGEVVIVAGKWDLEIANARGMHHHVIHVPEIDIRKIVSQNFLDLGINASALSLVRSGPSLGDQFVNARIGIVTAIAAFRWKARRIERVGKNIRILITTAHPAK